MQDDRHMKYAIRADNAEPAAKSVRIAHPVSLETAYSEIITNRFGQQAQ